MATINPQNAPINKLTSYQAKECYVGLKNHMSVKVLANSTDWYDVRQFDEFYVSGTANASVTVTGSFDASTTIITDAPVTVASTGVYGTAIKVRSDYVKIACTSDVYVFLRS